MTNASYLAPVVDSLRPVGVYPMRRGCLPRKSRPGELCPMASERIKVIPRDQWADYAQDASLTPFIKTVLDQDGVGSCATESSTGGVMIDLAMAGVPHVELNPWFIYQATSGGRDRGSSIDENLAFIRQYGIAPTSIWPRSKGWSTTPSEEAFAAALEFRIEEFYDIASIDEMVSALLLGFPVIYGADGHSVCKVQHLDDTKGLDLNSWGTSWGDNGLGVWASYRAVNWSYGAFAIRTVKRGAAA